MVEPEGSNIALIVSVQQAADGSWQVALEGSGGAQTVPLAPARFVVRLWRRDDGVLRGTLRRDRSATIAPFQCNTALALLVRDWLQLGEGRSSG